MMKDNRIINEEFGLEERRISRPNIKTQVHSGTWKNKDNHDKPDHVTKVLTGIPQNMNF